MAQSGSIICRDAVLDDRSVIIDFQMAMAKETENLVLDRPVCTKGVSAVFENPHLGKYYVAEKHDNPGKTRKVVGSLLIIPEWSDWRNGMVWWIHSVYVTPDERGNGIFSALYQMVQQKGEAQGNLRGLRLYVDKTNLAAQKVYRKIGMSNHHYELYEWMKNS